MASREVFRHGGEEIQVIGRHHYLVRSKTDRGDWHCLDLEGVEGEAGHCTCRSSETRKTCRHETVVLDWLTTTS